MLLGFISDGLITNLTANKNVSRMAIPRSLCSTAALDDDDDDSAGDMAVVVGFSEWPDQATTTVCDDME